jgi:uncharacterized membrane protein YGL010W
MNNALKGALLSGLIFPGLGQIVMKRYKRGTAIVLTVLVSLSIIVVKAVQLARVTLEEIDAAGGLIDMNTVMDAATRAATGTGTLTFNVLFALIVGCWVVGIVDAYLIGRKTDIEDNPPRPISTRSDR